MCTGRVTVQRNLGEYNGMLGLRHAFSHLHHVEATANLGNHIETPFGLVAQHLKAYVQPSRITTAVISTHNHLPPVGSVLAQKQKCNYSLVSIHMSAEQHF